MDQIGDKQAEYFPVYTILEGGGMKAIAHVGALRALEDSKRIVVGIAGTSAGAIIAALVAVGYTPQELFKGPKDNILTRYGYTKPSDLLLENEWRRVRNVSARLKRFIRYVTTGLLVGLVAHILTLLSPFYSASNLVRFSLSVGAVGLTSIGIFFIGYWFWGIANNRGVFDSSVIAEIVNTALRDKLTEHYKSSGFIGPPPKKVLFRHIDPDSVDGCIPLKIVVTNVSQKRLVLFDNRDADVCVADVVAASASLPLVFRPASIDTATTSVSGRFTDGGLVSNLPSWVFRDDKKARERREEGSQSIPIYACSLSSSTSSLSNTHNGSEATDSLFDTRVRAIRRPLRKLLVKSDLWRVWRGLLYFQKLIETGIFGSQAIVEDFVDDLRVIEIDPLIDTIDLDLDRYQAQLSYESGVRAVAKHLKEEDYRDAVTQGLLEFVYEQVVQKFVELRGAPPTRLRLALIDPVQENHQPQIVGFRVSYGVNMRDYADDRLELDFNNSISATAFNERKAHYSEVRSSSPSDIGMTKYEYALLPQDLESVIAIPIFNTTRDEQHPARILCIDSNDSLLSEFRNEEFISSLCLTSSSLCKFLIESTVKAHMEDLDNE